MKKPKFSLDDEVWSFDIYTRDHSGKPELLYKINGPHSITEITITKEERQEIIVYTLSGVICRKENHIFKTKEEAQEAMSKLVNSALKEIANGYKLGDQVEAPCHLSGEIRTGTIISSSFSIPKEQLVYWVRFDHNDGESSYLRNEIHPVARKDGRKR